MTAPQIKDITLPDSDIVAQIYSDIDGYVVSNQDVEIFQKHIIKVWQGLHFEDRMFLSGGLDDQQLVIRLVGHWGFDDHQQEHAIATAWSGCSNRIDFNWPKYQKLTNPVRCCLIAHEFGHIHHGVKGLTRLNMRPSDLPSDFIDLAKLDQGFLRASALPEIYANSMAKLWGFPPERFQTFMLRNADDCFISDRTARRHAIRNLWHHESWLHAPFLVRKWLTYVDGLLKTLSSVNAVTVSLDDVYNSWEGVIEITHGRQTVFTEAEPEYWRSGHIREIGSRLARLPSSGRYSVKSLGNRVTIEFV